MIIVHGRKENFNEYNYVYKMRPLLSGFKKVASCPPNIPVSERGKC